MRFHPGSIRLADETEEGFRERMGRLRDPSVFEAVAKRRAYLAREVDGLEKEAIRMRCLIWNENPMQPWIDIYDEIKRIETEAESRRADLLVATQTAERLSKRRRAVHENIEGLRKMLAPAGAHAEERDASTEEPIKAAIEAYEAQIPALTAEIDKERERLVSLTEYRRLPELRRRRFEIGKQCMANMIKQRRDMHDIERRICRLRNQMIQSSYDWIEAVFPGVGGAVAYARTFGTRSATEGAAAGAAAGAASENADSEGALAALAAAGAVEAGAGAGAGAGTGTGTGMES